MNATDLPRLALAFPADDIEWKPGATTRDKSKGLAMAYLTSRAVQQRLDDVCGPADWRNEFTEGPGGGVLCGISIRIDRETASGTVGEWVTKWDGAENSQVEAIKGGLSGATKRAAVQWGIGRYLYELPATWVRLDDRGRFAETPRIPSEHLPQQAQRPAQQRPQEDEREPITLAGLIQRADTYGVDRDDLARAAQHYHGTDDLEDLTAEQRASLRDGLDAKYLGA